MALTFTGTLDVASAGREDVRMLLVGTIGCNIAWGLVDAVMFLVTTLTERGRSAVTIRSVRAAGSPEQARAIVADALPPLVAKLMPAEDVEHLTQRISTETVPDRPSLNGSDWLAAFGVFLLVFLSTFPVVIPFFFMNELHRALRTSNAVAIVMLFASGYMLARYGGYRPLVTGISMVLLGVALVGIAIALGG